MKNYIYIMLISLYILTFSCSSSQNNLLIMESLKNKLSHIDKVIRCKAKTNKYQIVNKSELQMFLLNNEPGLLRVNYKTENKQSSIEIDRIGNPPNQEYIFYIRRSFLPFTKCYNIVKPKTFK